MNDSIFQNKTSHILAGFLFSSKRKHIKLNEVRRCIIVLAKQIFNIPAYVYVYIDKRTGNPVYVGKVNSGSSLDSRINDHRHDHWYEARNHIIYYTPVESSGTADILETALINEFLKEGYPLFNIAKTSWGATSHISKDSFGWIPYEKYNDRIIKLNEKRLETLDSIIELKERDLHDLQFELEVMSDPNYDFL